MLDLKDEEQPKPVIASQLINQKKPMDPKVLVYDYKEYYSLLI